jgi:hypothetical protein
VPSLTRAAVDAFAQKVGVPNVAGVRLDKVDQDVADFDVVAVV